MNSQDRLNYMKRRFPVLKKETETLHSIPAADAVLPVTTDDVTDEASFLDAVREHDRGLQHLTSDATA